MRTSHLFNTQIWSWAVWGEYINRHTRVQTKSGTLQQTKSEKREGKRPFSSPSDEVLFVQGGCRAQSGTDGWREGGTDGRREGGKDEWLLHS